MIPSSKIQFVCIVLGVILEVLPSGVNGHASQIDPPGRHSGWWNTINNCGNGPNNDGVGRRQSNADGTGDYTGLNCGVCGDAIYVGTTMTRNYTTPRACEVGGIYYPPNPVIAYVQEQVIGVTVQIGNNHGGGMEWRLCNNDTSPEVQDCFNANLLEIVGASSGSYGDIPLSPATTRFILPGNVGGNNLLYVKLQLPKGVSCYRCTLQFTYLGSANQMFRTCLDMNVRPFEQLVLFQNQGSGTCLRQAFQNNTGTLNSAICDINDVDQFIFTFESFKSLSNDSVYIGSSTQCLNVNTASTKSGASVVRYSCNRFAPQKNEKWTPVFYNAGTHAEVFQLVQTGNSNLCLGLINGLAYQVTCSTDSSQFWKIVNRSNYQLAPPPALCLP